MHRLRLYISACLCTPFHSCQTIQVPCTHYSHMSLNSYELPRLNSYQPRQNAHANFTLLLVNILMVTELPCLVFSLRVYRIILLSFRTLYSVLCGVVSNPQIHDTLTIRVCKRFAVIYAKCSLTYLSISFADTNQYGR